MSYPIFNTPNQPKPMQIHIFDVEHGECSAIETPSGDLMLIGAGHNATTNWRPSSWIRQLNRRPTCMVLTNLDRDHLSDPPNFEPHLRPALLVRNQSITPEWLRAKKLAESREVHPSVETAVQWIKTVFTGPLVPVNLGMDVQFFSHPFPTFSDTNNLSVVTFIRHGNCGIMFPGDLECAGWQGFLQVPAFVECLRNTNVLVASHHGREGGYCKDIFAFCRPDVVIISDKPVAHDTQNHDYYSPHCLGITFRTGQMRKVLTTRRDGKMTIHVPARGLGTIDINQPY